MSNPICPKCGGELCWNSDEMASDVYGGEYAEDKEARTTSYTCLKCGRSIEVTDPVEEDREGQYAQYWKNDKN